MAHTWNFFRAGGFDNIPFGTSLADPYAEKLSVWPYYAIIAAGVTLIGLWYFGFWG